MKIQLALFPLLILVANCSGPYEVMVQNQQSNLELHVEQDTNKENLIISVTLPESQLGWFSVGFVLRKMYPADVVVCEYSNESWRCYDSYMAGSRGLPTVSIPLPDNDGLYRRQEIHNLNISGGKDLQVAPVISVSGGKRNFILHKNILCSDPFDLCVVDGDSNIKLAYALHLTSGEFTIDGAKQRHTQREMFNLADLPWLSFNNLTADLVEESQISLLNGNVFLSARNSPDQMFQTIWLNVDQSVAGWVAFGVGQKAINHHTYVGDVVVIYQQDNEWNAYDCWATGVKADPLFAKDDGNRTESVPYLGKPVGTNDALLLSRTIKNGRIIYEVVKRLKTEEDSIDYWDWNLNEGFNHVMVAYSATETSFPNADSVPTDGESKFVKIKYLPFSKYEPPKSYVNPDFNIGMATLTVLFTGFVLYITYITR